MIKAIATGADGKTILILGIDKENVRRLKDNQPIFVNNVSELTAAVADAGAITALVLYYGDTQDALIASLEGVMAPDAAVVHGGPSH